MNNRLEIRYLSDELSELIENFCKEKNVILVDTYNDTISSSEYGKGLILKDDYLAFRKARKFGTVLPNYSNIHVKSDFITFCMKNHSYSKSKIEFEEEFRKLKDYVIEKGLYTDYDTNFDEAKEILIKKFYEE